MDEAGTMNKSLHFHEFPTKQELAETLSQAVIENLQEAIRSKGKATLLVSGGSTPKALFETLQKKEIDWDKVYVGLCDERWVEPQHPDSNERLIKTTLLQDKAAQAHFIGLYHDNLSPKDASSFCSEQIKSALFPFDVVILGMGNDAHTASLFPHNPKLKEAFDSDNSSLCIAIEPSTAPHSRMSLTLPAILGARHLYLHFEGEEKRALFEHAMQGSDIYEMPIRAILQQKQKNIEVYYA